jgi:hypothetical protein
MLNRQPIFINGFSRGGTTIFTNLLASHPEVCTVSEVHHLFKGHNLSDSPLRVARKCLFHDLPVIVGTAQDFFSPRLVKERKRPPSALQKFIDRVIYREKLRSQNVYFNRFKRPGVEYTRDEIKASRLVIKNIDGMIYGTDTFAEMYPDASFVGLVRNGLALCEGHLRRGRPAEELGRRYRLLVEKMRSDAERLPRYRLFRFEDLLTDPGGCMAELYQHCGLDIQRLQAVRMQVRRVMDRNGQHRLTGNTEWQVVWYDVSDLSSYFQPDVNENQLRRLQPADRDAFLREAGNTMEQLGYSTDVPAASEPVIYSFPSDQQQDLQKAA